MRFQGASGEPHGHYQASHRVGRSSHFDLCRLRVRKGPPPDLVLTGDVTGAQNKTYFEVPFTVPAGTHRISVDFQYTGKEERATLDLGVCRSGALSRRERRQQKPLHHQRNRCNAVLSARRNSGRRRGDLLIAVPNMRPQTVSHYRAENSLQRPARRTRASPPTPRHRHALVSRRPAHAYGPQRRQLSQPERQAGSLPALSHRADGGCARPGLHRHHRPQRRLAIRCGARVAALLRPCPADSRARDDHLLWPLQHLWRHAVRRLPCDSRRPRSERRTARRPGRRAALHR